MKKLIATVALLSCVFSVNAASCETFGVSQCSSQVIINKSNNLNQKQFATSICINNGPCGEKMATVSLVPTCNTPCPTPCASPVVVQNSCEPYNPCGM